MFPADLRDAVVTAYLLCRILDSIEDDTKLAPREREALFDAFDTVLADDDASIAILEDLSARAAVGETSTERDICKHAARVIRSFRRLALPTREAQVKQAFVAITLVFFLGVAIGFALAKAF